VPCWFGVDIIATNEFKGTNALFHKRVLQIVRELTTEFHGMLLLASVT
jgi:hypothetical protein